MNDEELDKKGAALADKIIAIIENEEPIVIGGVLVTLVIQGYHGSKETLLATISEAWDYYKQPGDKDADT